VTCLALIGDKFMSVVVRENHSMYAMMDVAALEGIMPRTGQDLTGVRFGRLVALEKLAEKGHPTRWLCRCDCGETANPTGSQLLGGRVHSCGCIKAENNRTRLETHGMSHLRVYHIWQAMKNRCYNPNQPHYARYGGHGVTVCDEWRKSFEAFYAAMGNPPTDKHSIDRISNGRGYEPGNCRWATAKEQAANQRPKPPVTWEMPRGEGHFKATITEEMVREIRASAERNCDIARRIGLSKQSIADIRKGRTWRHVT
jgi:hypothetical protein